MGDLLRALGQNPTQAEVASLAANAPPESTFRAPHLRDSRLQHVHQHSEPAQWIQAGRHTRYVWPCAAAHNAEEFIRGFQVFDKDGTGHIGVGELRYVLTSLGEKLSDEEVDELLKGVAVSECVQPQANSSDGNINYEAFVRQILSQ